MSQHFEMVVEIRESGTRKAVQAWLCYKDQRVLLAEISGAVLEAVPEMYVPWKELISQLATKLLARRGLELVSVREEPGHQSN